MKKILLVLFSAMLAACSSHPPVGEPKAPLDTKAVEAYNKQVYNAKAKTVPTKTQEVDMPMNASDKQSKTIARPRIPVVIAPSIGYYHGYRHYHY